MYTQKHLEYRRWLHMARTLYKYGGAYSVAEALLKLNQYAKVDNFSASKLIYPLKNKTLETFCQELPYTVELERQVLVCRSCGGTGMWDWDEECYHCGGTGIYRKTILYRFTFVIDGKYYTWHQPEALVTWKVNVGSGYAFEDLPEYQDQTGRVMLSEAERNTKMLTLMEYLKSRGYSAKDLPTLNRDIANLFHAVRKDLYAAVYGPSRRIWEWKNEQFYKRGWKTDDEWVPF
jgi:hypothetical protein